MGEVEELLEIIPIVESMTQIRYKIEQRKREQLENRFNKGEIVNVGMFGNEDERSYQTGETLGSSSNDARPRINVIRVIKVEVEDDIEENKKHRFIMTIFKAITLSVIIQWLFGKCTKRNRAQSTPSQRPEEEETSE